MRNALVSRLCPFVFAAAVSAQGAGFEPPALQTVLNSTSIDTEPCLSFDGLTLWFYSNRTGGVGGLDIYSTTRSYIGGPWSAPVWRPQPLARGMAAPYPCVPRRTTA